METITTFVLGVLSALGILSLGYAFLSTLKINKITQSIQKDIEDLYKELDMSGEQWYESISELDEETRERINELNSYVDSRFDKQADKASNVISVVSESSLENADRLNKLEETLKFQIDQFAKISFDHDDRITNLEIMKKIKEEQINS